MPAAGEVDIEGERGGGNGGIMGDGGGGGIAGRGIYV